MPSTPIVYAKTQRADFTFANDKQYVRFAGKIYDHWHKAAKANGFSILARVIDRYQLLLRCHTCDGAHVKRLSVVTDHKPECPHCIHKRRLEHAHSTSAVLIGHDPKNRHYGLYQFSCGHRVRRQYSRVQEAAKGGHTLGCEECRVQSYAKQAMRFGWHFIGSASSGKTGYRAYRHTCGQVQDISVGNMTWGDCACKKCSPGRTSRPSAIYLFRINLPGLTVLKLGYSARPEKRLKHQLGIDKSVETEVLRVIGMPTGHDARAEEEHSHGILRDKHPEWVVPKSAYGDAINTVAEIYDPQAEPIIQKFMDEIETRYDG